MPSVSPEPLSERDRVVRKATELPLLDAAFEITYWNTRFARLKWAEGGEVDVALLSDRFLPQQIAEAQRSVYALLNDGWRIAKILYANRFSAPEAEQDYRDRHPGFGETTYRAAIDFALFENR